MNDAAKIDPSSLVVMKLHQMKRAKADSHDHIGNRSASVTLRDKIISSPKMMPHPFKRRDTTAIELFQGLEKMTSDSLKPNANAGTSTPTTTQIVFKDDSTPASPAAKARPVAGDTSQSSMQMINLKHAQGEGEHQPKKDNKLLPVVSQSSHDDIA